MEPKIIEDESKYQIILDVPGYSKDHLKINYEDGVVYISGQNKERGEFYINADIAEKYGEINVRMMTAKLESGVLKINVMKIYKSKSLKVEWL